MVGGLDLIFDLKAGPFNYTFNRALAAAVCYRLVCFNCLPNKEKMYIVGRKFLRTFAHRIVDCHSNCSVFVLDMGLVCHL